MPTPDHVVAAARAYEGVRWRHQGRGGAGLDCLGLIVAVAVDLGLDGAAEYLAAEARNYGRLPPNRLAAAMLEAGLRRAPMPATGRIGLFAQPGAYPSHVGIFGDMNRDGGELIQALASAGRVVRHGYDRPWRDALRGVFAYPGVE